MGDRPRSQLALRALERKASLRTGILERHPGLNRPLIDPGMLVLGNDERGRPVAVPAEVRGQHCIILGATGAGKTKLIEHKIRQDILHGRGVCLIDPHGSHPDSCFRSVLSWMEREGLVGSRPIHLIDPNVGTHVTGFDPLSLPDANYDPAVIADAVLEAIEKLWGEEDTNSKPTLQRVLTAAVTALCELRLTLNELHFLFDDPDDETGVRAWIISELHNEVARGELRWLDDIAKEPRGRGEFRLEVTGPRNRFSKITHLDSLSLMVGQQERNLDFRAALDEGHVILVNLAPGPRLSDKAAQLLGRLLLRMLFFHAQRRTRTDRWFHLYCDEAHLFLSSDVARFLSEIRKYGCACVLSTQHQAGLAQAGLDVLDSVKSNTNIKIIFRSRDPEQAAELAEMVVPLDLERPVEILNRPAVVGHRIRTMHGEARGEQFSTTLSRGTSYGTSRSVGTSRSRTATQSASLANGHTAGESASWSDGWSTSHGASTAAGTSSTDGTAAADGTSESDAYAPPAKTLFGERELELRGSTKGKSSQNSTSAARTLSASRAENSSRGANGSEGGSWSVGRSFSRSRGWASSEGLSTSISRATSEASSTSVGKSSGVSSSTSLQEALEPIYHDLPGAVHGIENVRYMAARAVRNLRTGQAIISFVDAKGLQTSFLQVSHVESCTLPEDQFVALRTQVLEASPSALRTEAARAHIAQRAERVIAAAKKRNEPSDTPAAYRTKKRRGKDTKRPEPVDESLEGSEPRGVVV
jgi:Type IV secretion-system coupling protein DNA-binding domain